MYFIWYIIIGIIAGFVAGKLMRGGVFLISSSAFSPSPS